MPREWAPSRRVAAASLNTSFDPCSRCRLKGRVHIAGGKSVALLLAEPKRQGCEFRPVRYAHQLRLKRWVAQHEPAEPVKIAFRARRRSHFLTGVNRRAQPIVQKAIDYEMNAICLAAIFHAVRQAKIDIPA